MNARTIRTVFATLPVILSLLAQGRTDDEAAAQQPKIRSVPYVLDNERYAAEVAAARDDAQRRELLHPRWEAVKLAVLHCDVVMDMAFYSSWMYWRSGYSRGVVTINESVTQPRVSNAAGLTIIQGDCLAEVTLAEGTSLHVYGNLDATVHLKGQNEVVVGGSVHSKGTIHTDGISRVFIGGDLAGRVVNKGSAKVWVHGNLPGEVGTGRPSTHLHVVGDLPGIVKPSGEQASLLSVEVLGFAPYQTLEATAQHKYTQFYASIAASDRPPGIYPPPLAPGQLLPPPILPLNSGFVIHRQVDAKHDVPSAAVAAQPAGTNAAVRSAGANNAASPSAQTRESMEFLGVLALAVDDSVAKTLTLTNEQRAQLLKRIDKREEGVLDLALSLKGATEAEREARLVPFRAESEKLGLPILTESQRVILERHRIRITGMIALGEPKIAEKLGLTDEQKQQIAKYLTARSSNLAKVKPEQVERVKTYYENVLLKVLNAAQLSAWLELAGEPANQRPK